MVVGSWLSFHRRASGVKSCLGKREAGWGQRESLTRARPPSKIGGRGLHADGVSHVLGVGRFGERFGRSRLLKGNPHSLGLGRARNAGKCILSSESQRGVAHTSKVRA